VALGFVVLLVICEIAGQNIGDLPQPGSQNMQSAVGFATGMGFGCGNDLEKPDKQAVLASLNKTADQVCSCVQAVAEADFPVVSLLNNTQDMIDADYQKYMGMCLRSD